MTDEQINLPPPTLERTYYCNKCGHMGPVGESHPLPDGSGLCNYYAVSNGPYWNEEAVRAAVLADRAARAAAPDAESLRSELDRAWKEVDAIAKERDDHRRWRAELADDLGEVEKTRDALGAP